MRSSSFKTTTGRDFGWVKLLLSPDTTECSPQAARRELRVQRSKTAAARLSPRVRLACRALVLGFLVPCLACTPEAEFHLNSLYALKMEKELNASFDATRSRELGNVMVGMFGTPDDPHVPAVPGVEIEKVLDETKLQFAAGAVGRDEQGRRMRGLYREHCAHCHGITGDGAGPTAAFLNPYPRDYRMGVFKFKSTPKGYRPTHDDLMRILIEGVAGTAMPSFKVLPQNEVEALVHYVRYLSIRGEVERGLMSYIAMELDPEDRLFDVAAGDEQKAEQIEVLQSFVAEVVDKWVQAEGMATEVPAPDPQRDLTASITRGRELFYGTVANCMTCHGDSQLGDGQTNTFDDWTKEISPEDPAALDDYLALGALEPRHILPRNLRLGVYRGGRRPIDLYWRIRNGIDGTPMPGSLIKPADAPPEVKGLSEEDLWSLIDYVRSLPYETVSYPSMPEADYQRERL